MKSNALKTAFVVSASLLVAAVGLKDLHREKKIEKCLAEQGIVNVMVQADQSNLPHTVTLVEYGPTSHSLKTYDFDSAKITTTSKTGETTEEKFDPSEPSKRKPLVALLECSTR